MKGSLFTGLLSVLLLTCASAHAQDWQAAGTSCSQQIYGGHPERFSNDEYARLNKKLIVCQKELVISYCQKKGIKPNTNAMANCLVRRQVSFDNNSNGQFQEQQQQQGVNNDGGAGIDYNLLGLGLSMMGNHAPAPTHTTCYRTGDLVNCDSR